MSASETDSSSRKPTPDAKTYYGYLFEADKKPTKILDALLRGVAVYISENIEPTTQKELTPEKLSAFYKAVGGDYDPLFTLPSPTLSWIYTTLGCAHLLLPNPKSDFVPPSLPALTPRGFARWQSIEILLGPDEHVPFIQYAVQNFHVKHPETGEEFPCPIPISAFPLVADESVVKWHERCAQRLRPASGSDKDREDDGKRSDPVPEMREKEKFRGVNPQARPSIRPSTTPRTRTDRNEKVRDDHFERQRSRPVSVAYAHVSAPTSTGDERPPSKASRPGLVRSFGQRARQFLAPEDASTKGKETERGRRRSYPEEPVSDHGPNASRSHPASKERRGEDEHRRHHSVPRHRRRGSMSSDASSEAEVPTPPIDNSRRRATPYSSSGPGSRSTSRPVSVHENSPHLSSSNSPPPRSNLNPHIHHQSATPVGEVPSSGRYSMPPPPPPPRPRDKPRSDHNDEKRRSYVAPDKTSAPFYDAKDRDRDRGSERSTSHGRSSAHLRWKDLDGASLFPSRQNSQSQRRSSDREDDGRRANLSEKERDRRVRERAGTGTHERPRLFVEERAERRHSHSDRETTREGGMGDGGGNGSSSRERDRDRRGGFGTPGPVRGVDGRYYPAPAH